MVKYAPKQYFNKHAGDRLHLHEFNGLLWVLLLFDEWKWDLLRRAIVENTLYGVGHIVHDTIIKVHY